MEQPRLYLTFDEYMDLGGTLDESSFSLLALDANSYIDWYTFNRLWDEEVIPDKVKYCEFQLIKLLYTKMNLITPDTTNTDGVNTAVQLESQANDGVSVSYGVLHADEIYYNSKKEIEECIIRYLNGLVTSAGKKLLYRGLYPDE